MTRKRVLGKSEAAMAQGADEGARRDASGYGLVELTGNVGMGRSEDRHAADRSWALAEAAGLFAK